MSTDPRTGKERLDAAEHFHTETKRYVCYCGAPDPLPTEAGDVEALAGVLLEELLRRGWDNTLPSDALPIARAVLASDWLAQHTAAALAARETETGLRERVEALADEAKARMTAYPRHPHWEAWRMYEADLRDALRAALDQGQGHE